MAQTADRPSSGSPQITVWLRAAAEGDHKAEERLLQVLYDDLHRLARRHIRAERPAHTLQATALVHEAYVRLMRGGDFKWNDRIHFFAVASTAMRRVLVDHARRRDASKRGNGIVVLGLDDVQEPSLEHSPERVLAIDQALRALDKVEPRQARIVEMKFFGGLTEDEISVIVGVSTRTVKREWTAAKAWLYERLKR